MNAPGKTSLFPYWKLPKNKALIAKSRELRKQGVLSEVLFWQAFKDKNHINGWDLDRQVIIGNYIVDFFIPELGLVIEIDGDSHDEKQAYDRKREEYLIELGLHIVHYLDSEVKQDISAVHTDLLKKIEARVQFLSSS